MASQRCKHGLVICEKCVVITDAAKRVHDAIGIAITFHTIEEISRGWMAFALADGQTDHTIYPSKVEAIRHQSDEFRYMYVSLARCIGGMSAKDAQLFLDVHRQAYDGGMRLTDPDNAIMMPQGREQLITRPTYESERGYVRPWKQGREFKPNAT